MDACSDAISEYSGRRSSVSERTIREDLRVMRSEILGFNAPIEQKDGLYFYSDMSYSLINIMIADEDLVGKVYNLLKEVSKKVSHPEMEDVLKRLGTVKVRTSFNRPNMAREIEETVFENRMPGMMSFKIPRKPKPSIPTWGEIFRILG